MGDFSPVEIAHQIYFVRGQQVMIDSDLAALYQVRTRDLNKAARRHPELFPGDFMFQLTKAEFANLKFQMGALSSGRHGGRRKLPYVFTEPGAAGLTGVLKSRRAAKTYVAIMRAFVRARHFFAANKDLQRRMARLEGKTERLYEDVKAVLRGNPQSPLLQPFRRTYGTGARTSRIFRQPAIWQTETRSEPLAEIHFLGGCRLRKRFPTCPVSYRNRFWFCSRALSRYCLVRKRA